MTEENTQNEQVSLKDELTQAFADAEAPEVKEVAKEVIKEEPALEEDVVEEEAQDEEVDEIEVETEKELPLIPKDWSAEEKERFEALLNSDDEDKRFAAEILIERYNNLKKGFYNKTMEYSQKTKELGEIDKVFKPFEQTMKANNVGKSQYIQNMVQWEQALHAKPVETVKAIMQQFGVKPEQIAPRQDFDYDEYDDEPKTNKEVLELKAELNNLRNQLVNQPIVEQVRQFASATDSEGKLLHPRFDEVKEIMGTLINKDSSLDLEKAYKKATRLFDDEQPTQNNDAVDIDKIRQKVAQSKKAQKSVKTSANRKDFSQMTLKEELAARFN